MSRQEQAALVAWINSFRPSRRMTSFEHLADGRAFMELLSSVDATHFKSLPTRGPGAGPSSPDNWVLKTNALKRIHRLLLSFSLPPPHHSLSTSTLPEPPFASIVKSPTSPEGTAGLLQLARMVLCVAVWAPGNERVIAKIQGLGEGHMAELMRGIEEVMGSMPPEDEGGGGVEVGGGMMDRLSRRGSPVKKEPIRPASPPGALRAERDRLTVENDELRIRVEQMAEQVAEVTASLDEAKSERDDALDRLSAARDAGGASALRSSQGAGSDTASLRTDLLKAEEAVAKMQDELSKKTVALIEMQVAMATLQEEAAEAAKMKDQLDEPERLQESENVIEKYKKKLDDSAAVRRELKNLEEENAQLLSINNGLEGELRKLGNGKAGAEEYRTQIATLEEKAAAQAIELAELSIRLESAQSLLHETEVAYERDKEDLELYRQKVREVELGSVPVGGNGISSVAENGVKGSLDEELDGLTSPAETRTDLKLKIRRLERELASHTTSSTSDTGARLSTLESSLRDAQKARDRYQAEYLASTRETLRLEARLDAISKGSEDAISKGSEGGAEAGAALKLQVEDLVREKQALDVHIAVVRDEAERLKGQLRDAKEDLDLMGKDEQEAMQALRRTARADVIALDERIAEMRDQNDALKERDRFRLEEIKTLLSQKVDLQTSSIDQRDKALLREMEFGDLKAQFAKGGISPEVTDRLLSLVDQNESLRREMDLLRLASQASEAEPDYSVFEEAQKSYESQISRLQSDLDTARADSAAAAKRYQLEQDLMLSAWHDLGNKVVREHLAAVVGGAKRSQPRAVPGGWLGRQRRWKEDAIFSR